MTAYSKQIIVFSLNGTLAKNGEPIDRGTADLLENLLKNKKVAIISGCSFPRFETQLLRSFKSYPDNFANLYLLPNSGTKLCKWKGTWCEEYSEHLTLQQKEQIMAAVDVVLRKVGWTAPTVSYGSIIQDRGSQVTFSGLGENAPFEMKSTWDPKRELREQMVMELRAKIPNYDIRIGGLTSIDITKRGVNKGYGLRKLEELLKVAPNRYSSLRRNIFGWE